jgi:primosomal protein N' (replication factor Y)
VGRGGRGQVLVQTLAPHARAIVHAARHDSDGFLGSELERRSALGYPPFAHLIRITCSAVQTAAARAAAGALAELLVAPLRSSGAQLLGPAALFRLRGRERQVLVVKAAARRESARAVGASVQQLVDLRAHPGVNFSVDVDPQ